MIVSSSLYASLVPLVRCLSARYAPEGLASLTPFHRGTRCREKRGKEGVGDARSEGSERSPRLSDPFHLPLSSVSHRRTTNRRNGGWMGGEREGIRRGTQGIRFFFLCSGHPSSVTPSCLHRSFVTQTSSLASVAHTVMTEREPKGRMKEMEVIRAKRRELDYGRDRILYDMKNPRNRPKRINWYSIYTPNPFLPVGTGMAFTRRNK